MGVVSAVSLPASKKADKTQSTHDKLVGQWKYKQVVLDGNNNGIQDATDSTVNMEAYDFQLKFNSDGTGISLQSGVRMGSFSWFLANNDTYLRVADSGSTNSQTLFITTPHGTTFVYRDTANGQNQWETLVKQ